MQWRELAELILSLSEEQQSHNVAVKDTEYGMFYGEFVLQEFPYLQIDSVKLADRRAKEQAEAEKERLDPNYLNVNLLRYCRILKKLDETQELEEVYKSQGEKYRKAVNSLPSANVEL